MFGRESSPGPEIFRDEVRNQSLQDEGLLTADGIEDFVAINRRSLEHNLGPSPEFTGRKMDLPDGEVVAFEVEFEDEHGDAKKEWVSLDLVGNRARYVDGSGKTLHERRMPAETRLEMEMARDSSSKSVTPRTPGQYADEFGVDFSELWPDGGKVLVVGDPYQKCDREGVTIVDYEYAEEIMPADFYRLLVPPEADGSESGYNDINSWWNLIHAGNEKSLTTGAYNYFTETPGEMFIGQIKRRLSEWYSLEAQGNPVGPEGMADDIKLFRRRLTDLLEGRWEMSDFEEMLPTGEAGDRARSGMMTIMEIEREKLHPRKEAMHEYTEDLRRVVDALPAAWEDDAEFASAVGSIEGHLRDLSGMNDGPRMRETMNRLEAVIDRIRRKDHEAMCSGSKERLQGDDVYRLDKLNSALATGLVDHSDYFGMATPGSLYNRRAENYLRMAVRTMEKTRVAFVKIIPLIKEQLDFLEKQDAHLSKATKEWFANRVSAPLVRENLFERRANRAVSLHGFFPKETKSIEPQDRILALYSTSTHVMDGYVGPDDFSGHFREALAQLKVGGKYILGPINWKGARREVAASREDRILNKDELAEISGLFDHRSLSQALTEMRDGGEIDFSFRVSDPESGEDIDVADAAPYGYAKSLSIVRVK